MNKYQATLFSNESDIYTALHSNHAKITEITLRKIAFQRGIVFPQGLSKEVLIEKISDLPFSYKHVKEIQDKLATKSSQDIYSVKRIYEGFDIEKLYDVLNKVIAQRPKMLGYENIEHYAGLQTYHVSIDYTEFDFRRGKFQQKKMYSGDIVFIIRNGYVSVRYNYTQRISDILNEIFDIYRTTVSKDISINEIDFSGVLDSDFRNIFAVHLYDFDGLYSSTGFDYIGLEKVRVSKIKTILNDEVRNKEEQLDCLVDSDATEVINIALPESSDFRPLSSDENDSELEDEEKDDSDSSLAKDDEENLTFNINNAAYDGISLINAPQINDLCKDGFYRSLIRWKSLSSNIKGYVFTFELSFDDKYFARNIKFRALYKEKIGVTSVREKLTDADFDIVMRQLEEKIFLINDFIIEEFSKRYPAEETESVVISNQEANND